MSAHNDVLDAALDYLDNVLSAKTGSRVKLITPVSSTHTFNIERAIDRGNKVISETESILRGLDILLENYPSV